MKFFDSLLGRSPQRRDGEGDFQEGRSKFWSGDTDKAGRLLSAALEAGSPLALALAYRSLVKRAKLDVQGALDDAAQAVAADGNCFEAHAARSLALLTAANLPKAVQFFGSADERVPHDVEGHCLKLILHLLYTEMLVNSVETPDGAELNFKLTPTTRAATRLLEGRPELALQEISYGPETAMGYAARGLVLYRLGGFSAAAMALQVIADASQPGDGGKFRLSVKRLLLEVKKKLSA
jgi:tetratricopeptide (TPR) repeat protein